MKKYSVLLQTPNDGSRAADTTWYSWCEAYSAEHAISRSKIDYLLDEVVTEDFERFGKVDMLVFDEYYFDYEMDFLDVLLVLKGYQYGLAFE